MALDEDNHEVLREVEKMESVTDMEYVDSPDSGMPSRLYVQFEEDVDVLSVAFQEWMLEAGVAAVNVGLTTDGVYDALYVELQDVAELT